MSPPQPRASISSSLSSPYLPIFFTLYPFSFICTILFYFLNLYSYITDLLNLLSIFHRNIYIKFLLKWKLIVFRALTSLGMIGYDKNNSNIGDI